MREIICCCGRPYTHPEHHLARQFGGTGCPGFTPAPEWAQPAESAGEKTGTPSPSEPGNPAPADSEGDFGGCGCRLNANLSIESECRTHMDLRRWMGEYLFRAETAETLLANIRLRGGAA